MGSGGNGSRKCSCARRPICRSASSRFRTTSDAFTRMKTSAMIMNADVNTRYRGLASLDANATPSLSSIGGTLPHIASIHDLRWLESKFSWCFNRSKSKWLTSCTSMLRTSESDRTNLIEWSGSNPQARTKAIFPVLLSLVSRRENVSERSSLSKWRINTWLREASIIAWILMMKVQSSSLLIEEKNVLLTPSFSVIQAMNSSYSLWSESCFMLSSIFIPNVIGMARRCEAPNLISRLPRRRHLRLVRVPVFRGRGGHLLHGR